MTVKMKSVGLVTNELDISSYAQGARVMQRTKRVLETHYAADLGGGKELRLPNDTAAGIWTVTVSKNPRWGALSTMAQTGVATLVVDDGESF